MKRLLIFGLISGALSAAMIAATVPLLDTVGIATTDVLGYLSIVLSLLLVFFGVRSYRENDCGGAIAFGRALQMGALITVVSSLCSVAAFQIVYFKLTPEFGDKFAACMIERARADGATEARIEEVARQASALKRLYDEPLTNAALTFGQSFVPGLLASLISALILRRRGAGTIVTERVRAVVESEP